MMKVPSPAEAERLLSEAAKINPGPWVSHNQVAGHCARMIARNTGMDEVAAYSLGSLHDIGRRFGVTDMRHILDGYKFMNGLGFLDSARVCFTHSFPYKDIRAYNGENDCTLEESAFIQSFLDQSVYDDYDKLIQLCDALSYPTGACYLEKRLVDVVLRRGFNDLTVPKWKAFFALKEYFDEKAGEDIYRLLGVQL